MFSRWLAGYFLFIGVLLLGLSVIGYFGIADHAALTTNNQPYLEVLKTNFQMKGAVVGKRTYITVFLHNRSYQAFRIIGLAEC